MFYPHDEGISMAESRHPDIHSRGEVRLWLQAEISRPEPSFSSYDPKWIKRYQRHVLRWLGCAPAGAVFLIAPLVGWDGKPPNFSTGEGFKDPAGPSGYVCKNVREARARRGNHPLTGVAGESKAAELRWLIQHPGDYTEENVSTARKLLAHRDRVLGAAA